MVVLGKRAGWLRIAGERKRGSLLSNRFRGEDRPSHTHTKAPTHQHRHTRVPFASGAGDHWQIPLKRHGTFGTEEWERDRRKDAQFTRGGD